MSAITYCHIHTLNKKEIFIFRIQNSSGAFVELMNYGATLFSVFVPDRDGHLQNVVLNFESIKEYISDNCYLGSSIGRLANRISNAEFSIDGKKFQLDKNDGNHCHHGGFHGFNKKVMDYRINNKSITFFGRSDDGECGFPGNVDFEITYSFSDFNELLIEYKAASDRRTPVNFTNHAYINLTSRLNDILDHELIVYADEFLEMDNEFLPSGKILKVENTAFDFKEYRKIRDMIPLKNENIRGYNTYFINNGNMEDGFVKLACLREHSSGRKMRIYSTMPGVLFYSGDYLNGKHIPFEGLCLEAQFYPDFPNHPDFPQSIIEPGKVFDESIKIVFDTYSV